MPRGLGLLLALLVVFSCTSGARIAADIETTPPVELAPSQLAAEQRRSLRHVFYRNNDAPPLPTRSEERRLDRDFALAPPVEVQELHDLFGEDVELLIYATRDSDNDGVLDYRISEYRGKFFEGDIDLDGDGIRNVYDSAPYDPEVGGVDQDGDGVPDKPGSFEDRDGDGIPDHLDWSRRKAEPLPELQANLFRDFGLILVERSARFSPELAQAIDDTMRFVIRDRLSTLRTVAVEDQLLISPDLGDNGFMLAQTQTLTICTSSIESAKPVVLLGLVIHEVGHAWQLAQDFDERELAAENVKMHFPPGRFTRSLERFGWKVDRGTLDEGYHHRLYWPHFYATSPRYLYRGSSPNEWATWFEDVQRESGPGFLRNSPAVTWGMVGPYSLTSPWEWHADHLMAALYNRIDRGLDEHPNRTYRNIAGLLRTAMLESIQRQWSRYDYRNAVGTSIDRELGRRFALTDDEIQVLVNRYVIPLADFPMLSEALALDTAAHDGFSAFGVGLALDDTWDQLNERMHEPMRQRPDLHALVDLGLRAWDVGDSSDAGDLGLEEGGAGGGEDADGFEDGAGFDVDDSFDGGVEAGDAFEEADLDPSFDDGLAVDGEDGPGTLRDSPVDRVILDARERSLGPHSTARSGLPSVRRGAGRVGGYTTPVPDAPSAVGDGEGDDGDDGEDGDDREDGDAGGGDSHGASASLFEQLRGSASLFGWTQKHDTELDTGATSGDPNKPGDSDANSDTAGSEGELEKPSTSPTDKLGDEHGEKGSTKAEPAKVSPSGPE